MMEEREPLEAAINELGSRLEEVINQQANSGSGITTAEAAYALLQMAVSLNHESDDSSWGEFHQEALDEVILFRTMDEEDFQQFKLLDLECAGTIQ